jgi:hypothetical protein
MIELGEVVGIDNTTIHRRDRYQVEGIAFMVGHLS